MDSLFVGFLAIAALLTVTPGSDMALVTRNALRGGRRGTFLTTLGICLGCVVHATASAFGLSAILATSAAALEAVKLVGAGYVILLGLQAIREAMRTDGRGPSREDPGAGRAHDGSRNFVEGLLTNVLNPKVALFYMTFVPQFVPSGAPLLQRSLLLGSVHVAMGFVWLLTYGALVGRFARGLSSGPARQTVQALTGMALAGLGLRLAFERR